MFSVQNLGCRDSLPQWSPTPLLTSHGDHTEGTLSERGRLQAYSPNQYKVEGDSISIAAFPVAFGPAERGARKEDDMLQYNLGFV